MHFYIEKSTLIEGIAIVQKALPAKSSLPVLDGIYMSANGDSLLLKCCDLSMQIETTVAADIREEGAIVLPALLAEMAQRLPDGIDVEIHCEGNTVKITAGSFKTSLQGSDAEQFPELSISDSAEKLILEQQMLRSMIRQTVFATAQDESKPVLTGALLEADAERLDMVALDGYRLALRSEFGSFGAKAKAVLPARTLNEIARSLSDSKDSCELSFSRNQVQIDLGHTRIVARLLEGEFTKFRQILPSEHKTRIRVARAELQKSIERALLVARESKNNLVKFTITPNLLLINSNSEMGAVYDELPITLMGDELEIAFNAKFCIEVLRVLDCEEIFIDFTTSVSPCVVRPAQGDRFLYLILPVRLMER